MALFEMQHHSPIGYDGKQFTSLGVTSDYAEYSGEFGSPPNGRLLIPQPPSQFHAANDTSCGSPVPSVLFSPSYFGNNNKRQPNGQLQRGTAMPPMYANNNSYSGGYRGYDQSPRSSRKQFTNLRSSLTPTRSPSHTVLSSSPPFNGSMGSHFNGHNKNMQQHISHHNHSRGHIGGLSDESRDDSNRSYEQNGQRGHNRSALPSHTVDPNSGNIIYTFEQIVEEGLFEMFAKDKNGCHFLQENFPSEGTPLRSKVFEEIANREKFFEEMCKDVFANFFVQKMIEKSSEDEQAWIACRVQSSMFELCLNRYSCRVIQKVIEVLPDDLTTPLLGELHASDLITLSVDQNANHVIQKIFNTFDFNQWKFIVASLMKDRSFFKVVEDKYGCRVIQLAIELLSPKLEPNQVMSIMQCNTPGKRNREHFNSPSELLHALMNLLVDNCEELSSDEFANYVIQHVLKTPCLWEYREKIIEQCLLTHLLSLSQEKYASHVVEKAMDNASGPMLREMMDEIFDGYVPHPETKKDALDILLFHQFGNYVVQRMLNICLNVKCSRLDPRLREHWLARLEDRINRNASKLLRYSSGKKIIDMLREARGNSSITVSASSSSTTVGPRIPDRFL